MRSMSWCGCPESLGQTITLQKIVENRQDGLGIKKMDKDWDSGSIPHYATEFLSDFGQDT